MTQSISVEAPGSSLFHSVDDSFTLIEAKLANGLIEVVFQK